MPFYKGHPGYSRGKRAVSFCDLTGMVFNKWTVVGLSPESTQRRTKWLVQCKCGEGPFSIRSDALRSGHSKQCKFCRTRRKKPRHKIKPHSIPACHPKEPYGAHGLCRNCYSRSYQQRKTAVYFREHNMPATFYVYLWLRQNGTPYYVGKGWGQRGFTSKGHHVGRPSDRERILVQEYQSEQEAYEAERFLIEYYGRKDLNTGILRNRADGGRGGGVNRGKKHSAEHCRNISRSLTGKKLSEAHRLSLRKPKKRRI